MTDAEITRAALARASPAVRSSRFVACVPRARWECTLTRERHTVSKLRLARRNLFVAAVHGTIADD